MGLRQRLHGRVLLPSEGLAFKQAAQTWNLDTRRHYPMCGHQRRGGDHPAGQADGPEDDSGLWTAQHGERRCPLCTAGPSAWAHVSLAQ